MREIKFRGKRIDTGEWVYGYLFETPLTVENFEAGFLGTGKKRVCISDKCGVVFEVDPKTVGQFTGLHDKNGREIYEGDILSVNLQSWIGYTLPKILPVIFKQGAFGISEEESFKDFVGSSPEQITIIGNIHENQELMEGK